MGGCGNDIRGAVSVCVSDKETVRIAGYGICPIKGEYAYGNT